MADEYGPIITPMSNIASGPCSVCGYPRWQVSKGLFGTNGETMLVCLNCNWRQEAAEAEAKRLEEARK